MLRTAGGETGSAPRSAPGRARESGGAQIDASPTRQGRAPVAGPSPHGLTHGCTPRPPVSATSAARFSRRRQSPSQGYRERIRGGRRDNPPDRPYNQPRASRAGGELISGVVQPLKPPARAARVSLGSETQPYSIQKVEDSGTLARGGVTCCPGWRPTTLSGPDFGWDLAQYAIAAEEKGCSYVRLCVDLCNLRPAPAGLSAIAQEALDWSQSAISASRNGVYGCIWPPRGVLLVWYP